MLSNSPRNQTCDLISPSSLVFTPTPPQIFEIGKSSSKTHLKHHENQIEDILNYLDELSFHRIENWKKDVLMRSSTSATPAITQDAIQQLIAGFSVALEAQAAAMANSDNPNRNIRPREIPIAKRGNYKEFISCQPFYFNGTEGAIELIYWFERTESVFSRSKCAEEDKVTFATGTLTNDALSWWNSYAQPTGIDQANQITWTELKRLLTNKYCPQTEVKKMEDEFYNLAVKGNDFKTYIRRFQELAVLCPNMVPNTKKLLEVFISGLHRSIEGNVTASKPQTLEEAINIAQRLMDQIIKHNSMLETNDRKRKLEDERNINNNNYQNKYSNNNCNNDYHRQHNRRQEIFRTYTSTNGYTGNLPLCKRCRLHHMGPRSIKCQMPPKITSTSTAPTITQAAIRQLIIDGIAAALEAQATAMANADNPNRNTGPREIPVTKRENYKEFISCQPFYFNGTEGAVELIR
ncbi:reverse transcriptase domain-containing protein [Tanacetum coccineum]